MLVLRDWYEQHPDRRPFYLAYFGKVDPLDIGIAYHLPPRSRTTGSKTAPSLEPGWYAVNAAFLHGFEWVQVPDGNGGRIYPNGKPWDYFLHESPFYRAGHSILIYRVSD